MSASLGRVLVVDDSEVIRTLIAVNLELEGFEVIQAVDGQDALEKVIDVRPDVVTIDVKMPRLDGFDTVERLRADPRTHDLKIAMVTACAQADDLRRGTPGGRRRLRHQAVRPQHAGAHRPRPGRDSGLLTTPSRLEP